MDDTATTSTSYVDTSADEADTVYAYQVQALRGGVASASSATAVVVTPPPIPDDDELPDDADSVYLGAEDLGDISDQDQPQFPDYALDGDGDRVDYVRFTLTAAKKVSLGLRQLDADADLILGRRRRHGAGREPRDGRRQGVAELDAPGRGVLHPRRVP